jgi:hypothetical protein
MVRDKKRLVPLSELTAKTPPSPPPKPTPPPPKYDRLNEFAQLVQNPSYADCGDYIEDLLDFAGDNDTTLKNAYDTYLTEDKKAEYQLDEEQLHIAKMYGMSPSEYLKYS